MRIYISMSLRAISCNRSSSQLSCGASNKHNVVARWVQCPVVPFAWVIAGSEVVRDYVVVDTIELLERMAITMRVL